jgi:thiol-disulfide isomerase/thioredoxin
LALAWPQWALASATTKKPAPVAAAALASSAAQVAWRDAQTDAEVESAFKLARESGKPVLLYWGAKWCPYCNQLQATLFNRQDFIELTSGVVPVRIDGDGPGAQKLGSRFKVRGYPTLILMSASGQEITRLPGEVDAAQVVRVIRLGLSGGRPAAQLLADARSGKKLPASDWKALSFYSWDTDEEQLLPAADRATVLGLLSVAAKPVDDDAATRLWLLSLAPAQPSKAVAPDLPAASRLSELLAKPERVRTHLDVLANQAPQLVRSSSEPGEGRAALVLAFDQALAPLEADARVSRADRLNALLARVKLARLEQDAAVLQPKLAPRLVRSVRAHVAKADAEITDGFERQAVMTQAAHLLSQCGLWGESDALLKAGLSKSHSPFYLMNQLAANARKTGRHAEALSWHEQAWTQSQGPATRLQWGAGYVSALVDLVPADQPRIEKTAGAVFAEAAQDKAAFHERNARSMRRVASALETWGREPRNEPSLQRLREQLSGLCAQASVEDGQRSRCEAMLPALSPALSPALPPAKP